MAPPRRLSPENEAALVEDRRRYWMSYPELAAKYGVHPKTAENICKRNGNPRPGLSPRSWRMRAAR
jgi:hypothetical protein